MAVAGVVVGAMIGVLLALMSPCASQVDGQPFDTVTCFCQIL